MTWKHRGASGLPIRGDGHRARGILTAALLAPCLGALPAFAADPGAAPSWQWAGWGGGGLYWSAAFHPTQDGTIYLGGDVNGVAKTVDHGRHWRMINNGLASYAVYSLAVDPQSPQTVYAGTTAGLCKSTDGGEHWQFIPRTGPKELRITAERYRSVHAIAVDPSDSRVVYAASLAGKIYRSANGGQTWNVVYTLAATNAVPAPVTRRSKHGAAPTAGVCSVAVAAKNPALVLAATETEGILLSEDAGQHWRALATPHDALSVAVAPTDPNVLFGAFAEEGIWTSVDRGKTWTRCAEGLKAGHAVRDVAINPSNAQEVYAIGSRDWDGQFYASHDGGKTWTECTKLSADYDADPTRGGMGGTPKTVALSKPTNLAINPVNPNELFISANWRPCISADGGRTWTESDRGADISCIYGGVQFSGGRAYACCGDEGAFVSDNDGKTWRQLWPLKFDPHLSGHYWQQAVQAIHGKDRIIDTCSPWNAKLPNRVVISEDGGTTFKVAMAGLPDYRPTVNTMWGTSYPRALAVCPTNPMIVYLGMDGDATAGKSGGGIFKSEDGGYTWRQLPHQPGSRRGYFGLAIDPADPQRLYWGASGAGGGLYRSDDDGDSWQLVFKHGTWIFNVLVTADGTVYCPEKNLWRSTDHGATWQPLTHFASDGKSTIVGLEADPRDPRTLWAATLTWGDSAVGGVYKTSDGGATWQDITGDLPYRKPYHLRFNPATSELWAAGVGLYKIKQ